jgi:hypothetical protein
VNYDAPFHVFMLFPTLLQSQVQPTTVFGLPSTVDTQNTRLSQQNFDIKATDSTEQSPSAGDDHHIFYRTRRFITVFTTARLWSLSWARCTQSTPSHPASVRFTLALPSHLFLCRPSGLFPSSIPTKILCAFLISPTRITCRSISSSSCWSL